MQPEWLMSVGAVIGSTAAAFFAQRAATQSKHSAKSAQTMNSEVMGPGDEPSLRLLVQQVHGGMNNLGDRMRGLENAVFTHMESRLKDLEQSHSDMRLVSVTIGALTDSISVLHAQNLRAAMNIHKIAQVSHVTLFTEEEASIEKVRRESELKKGGK